MTFNIAVAMIAVLLLVLGCWAFWPYKADQVNYRLFYVGGTFTRYEEVRAIIDRLTLMGYECALDWTRMSSDFSVTDGKLLPSAQSGYVMMDHWPEAAQAEVDAIRRVGEASGFCIFLGEQASLGWPTEFGMAIMAGVPRIAVINPFKTTVFVALPQVEIVGSVDEAVDVLLTDLIEPQMQPA